MEEEKTFAAILRGDDLSGDCYCGDGGGGDYYDGGGYSPTPVYSELGADLPTPTKILMAISGSVVRFWWIVLTLKGIWFIAPRRTPRQQIDR